MSAVFRAYLWKEWREQRKLLGALALGLLLIVSLIVAAIDMQGVDASFSYTWVTTLCVSAAVLTVGSDLFARERLGQQFQFLERLPVGLALAFWSKLLLFLMVVCAAAIYGLALAALTGWLFGDGVARLWISDLAWHGLAVMGMASLWVFAVSTWIPTSVTAAPVAALMLGVWVAPVGLFHVLMNREVPWPLPNVWWFLGWSSFCAVIGARVCFVNASARARRKRVAVGWCLAIGVLAFLPVNTWAGRAWSDWTHRPYVIDTATIGEDGRFAFLTLGRINEKGRQERIGRDALVVELSTGDWRFEGERGASVFTRYAGQILFTSMHSILADSVDEQHRVAVEYDSKTGQPIESFKDSKYLSVPDEPADYGLASFRHPPMIHESGFGHVAINVLDDSSSSRCFFRSPDGTLVLETAMDRVRDVIVMHEGFLFRENESWQWIDPETEELTPIELLNEGDDVLALIDDGSLLVIREQGLFHVDLERGTSHEFEVDGFFYPSLRRAVLVMEWPSRPRALRTPVNPTLPLLIVVPPAHMSNGHAQVATLDLAERRLNATEVKGSREMALLWSKVGRVIVLKRNQQLIHHDLETGQSTVLFDVADLTR